MTEFPLSGEMDFCFKLGCHGFGVFDKAVRSNATYSILHDHVEDSIIVAPCFFYLEKLHCQFSAAKPH